MCILSRGVMEFESNFGNDLNHNSFFLLVLRYILHMAELAKGTWEPSVKPLSFTSQNIGIVITKQTNEIILL